MPGFRIYDYKACSTCQKALRYLDRHEIPYERFPIIDQPPTLEELKRMLGYVASAGGSFKNLFNTSGQLYREMGISEKLKAGMSEDEALVLLSKNGKLIKRPFFLTPRSGTVGFKEAEWAKLIR